MKVAFLAAPKFKNTAEVKRILELRGWSVSEKNPDYVFVIGGDGSVLYAASKFKETPIIALNAGKLGFLATNDISEIEEVLNAVEKGDFSLDKREKLDFFVGNEKGIALNEVLVTSSVAGKALRLEINIDKESVGSFVCDGVVVSTPTGSTGYNLSCGGPVIEPGTGIYAVTLVSPHLSLLKTLVVSDSRKTEISFARENPGITVVADGLNPVKVSHTEKIQIKKSKDVAVLVKLKHDYFSSLEKLFI